LQDVEFRYDSLINLATEDLTTPGSPSNMLHSTNYRWLIDAGAGNRVRLDFDSGSVGSDDYLTIWDGKLTSAKVIEFLKGQDSNLGNNFGGSGIVESSGRYMFVQISVDDGGSGGNEFDADITFF
jgi:hypothetical protein